MNSSERIALERNILQTASISSQTHKNCTFSYLEKDILSELPDEYVETRDTIHKFKPKRKYFVVMGICTFIRFTFYLKEVFNCVVSKTFSVRILILYSLWYLIKEKCNSKLSLCIIAHLFSNAVSGSSVTASHVLLGGCRLFSDSKVRKSCFACFGGWLDGPVRHSGSLAAPIGGWLKFFKCEIAEWYWGKYDAMHDD